MPFLFKVIFLYCMSGILFVVGSALPFANFYIENQKVTYKEWWLSGAGFIALLIGMILIVIGIGIFKRRVWAGMTFNAVFALF